MAGKKAKAETEAKSSVKSYQQSIDVEKQKMSAYSKKFGANVKTLQADVKSLQGDFKKYAKDIKVAAANMRETGIKTMGEKVARFKKDIQDQIKENREAASHMANNVKYFLSEINKKKKDFQSYARGPFRSYINAFWGINE